MRGRAATLAGLALAASLAASAPASASPRTPVVFFPGYSATRLKITVRDQTVAPACPRSGSFEDWVGNDRPSTAFDQVCRDKLLTLRYDRRSRKPMPLRFATQRGVTVTLPDYGRTTSAPPYEPLYQALERAGYVRDRDLRVAGYNWRLTPDMDGFLTRTKKLVQDTYRANGRRRVQLVGHSNGPLYAQYLLTHTSRAWKNVYIHGFTPIAGNFPGQGAGYAAFFTGLNVQDFSLPATAANAKSSARLELTSPAWYMSASDPRFFGDREVVVEDSSTGRRYTPRDYPRLFRDAGLPWARQIADYYIGFVRFADPADFPDVDVSAERGTGIPTVVGTALPNLKVGQVLAAASARSFTRDGDVNQEDITNAAVRVWRRMPCFRFRLTDNPGVNHLALPGDPGVVGRLLADLRRPRSNCP